MNTVFIYTYKGCFFWCPRSCQNCPQINQINPIFCSVSWSTIVQCAFRAQFLCSFINWSRYTLLSRYIGSMSHVQCAHTSMNTCNTWFQEILHLIIDISIYIQFWWFFTVFSLSYALSMNKYSKITRWFPIRLARNFHSRSASWCS